MAVIQYSALVTQLRGKLGGSQFNKGHAGYTLQRKSTPTIRQTVGQIRQRQMLALAQRSWKNESQQRQNEASAVAASNPVSNRFGQQVFLSGYNQYIKTMLYRFRVSWPSIYLAISEPFITTPLPSMVVSITSMNLSIIGSQPNGVLVSEFSLTKRSEGTISGDFSGTRGFVYLQRSTPEGVPIPGSRRMFFATTNVNQNPISTTVQNIYTSEIIQSGDWLLVYVDVINLFAGVCVGQSQTLIQVA